VRAPALTVALILAGLAGGPCREDGRGAADPDSAEGAARAVFDLARHAPAGAEQVDALFGPIGSSADRATLVDLLERVPAGARARVRSSARVGAGGAVAVDLALSLPAGGEQTWSIHVAPRPVGDGFTVVSVFGPGLAWPPRRAPRDGGLSVQPSG
jgi:hypothetical protein